LCHDHGPRLSGYWVCRHILDAGAPVELRLLATVKLSGVLLCRGCANHDVESATEPREHFRSNVRLVCPTCAHDAWLVESPEVS